MMEYLLSEARARRDERRSRRIAELEADCRRKDAAILHLADRLAAASEVLGELAKNAKRNTIHSMFGTPTYRAWTNMRRRCRCKDSASWKNYGGRGITVCKSWNESFRAFFEDMGERPPGKTLDRIDNDKGYFKDNCRWATKQEQGGNRRDNRYLEASGERLTISEWARRLECDTSTIYARIQLGWTIERSVTQKVAGRSKQ